MAIADKVNDLKDGPKENKVAVASGIAITVVVVLLASWAIFFLRNLQKNSQQLKLGGGAQDEFNFSATKQAQQQLQKDSQGMNSDELMRLRGEAASNQMQVGQDTSAQETQGQGTDQFGNPYSDTNPNQ